MDSKQFERYAQALKITNGVQPYINKINEMRPYIDMVRLHDKITSDSYQIFQDDCSNCLEAWQYYIPIDREFKGRFELDKEVYIETFWNPAHDHEALYDELKLIDRLINNLQNAKHPYFIEYREYLGNLKAQQQNITTPDKEVTKEAKPTSNQNQALDPLDPALIDAFNDAKSKFLSANSTPSKIKIAAFIEIAFDKKYFIGNRDAWRVLCNNAAMIHFGENCSTQFNTGSKAKREAHKTLIKKYFV